MRCKYKVVPVTNKGAAFPDEDFVWIPMLSVRLSIGQGLPTRRIDGIVDSGADACLFHADICSSLKISLKDGIYGSLSGVAGGVKIDAYYHDVNLLVGAHIIRIRAGFSSQIPVAALLGRRGFFEHFIVTFDPSTNPPEFELQRIGRA